MVEQILAYGGQNSYAQSEGAFTMSGSEPRESRPKRIENSERGQRHEASKQAESQRKPESPLFKPLNRPESERPSVPFSVAEPAITIINQIQNEKDVVASADDLAKMRMLNEQFGNEDDARKLTEVEDVVVYAQEVLRNSRIEEPTAEELHYTEGSPHAEGQKAVLKRQIAQAQGRDAETGIEDEEILTREKVRKHLTVEDYKGGVARENGPGAMAGDADDDEESEPIEVRSFKSLLQEKLDNLGKPVDMGSIDLEIKRRLDSDNPAYIHTAAKDLDTLRATREHDTKLLDEINQVFDPDLQADLLKAKERLDGKYTTLLSSLSTSGKAAILSDLDDEAKNALISLRYGSTSFSGKQKGFEMITKHLLSVAASEKEPPNLEGLRAWYALKKVEDVRTAYEIQQMTEIQPDPHENIKSIYAAMTFAQKSRSSEGFGTAQQRIEPLLQAVELSTDSSVTSEMKTRLREQFEAFLKITPNFILMYQSDGDTEQELRAATNIENESLFYFYDRFSDLKDKDGKLYFLDKDGNRLKDSQGYLLNPLSEMEGSDVYQYFLDRYRVNQVQKMTRRDLNIHSGNSDEEWIIKHILNEKGILKVAYDKPLPHLTLGQLRDLQVVWNQDGLKRVAAWEWYKRQTYIGVDGYYTERSNDVVDIDVRDKANKVYFGQKLRDVREDVIAQTIFRKRLEKAGMDPARIDALFKDYDSLQALKALGGNLARFKYSSAMDRFRIYNKSGDVVASIFGEETPYNEREVDHMPDVFIQEGHGDKRMNQLVLKKIDAKHRGFNLASNMRMYRLLSLEGVMTDDQRKEFDKEVAAEMKATGLERPKVEAYVLMSMVYEGFNPRDPSKQKLDIFNINWAEASKLAKHYTFDDNARDRINAVKFYRDAHKEFVFRPTEENLYKLFDSYYSTRAVRKEEGAEDYLELYREAGRFWKEWYDLEHNLTDTNYEDAVDHAKKINVISRKKAEKIKAEILGNPVFRNVKQWGDFLRVSALEFGKPGYLASSVWDWLKTLMAYLSQQIK